MVRALMLGVVLAPVAVVAQVASDGSQGNTAQDQGQTQGGAMHGPHGDPAERQQHMLKMLTKRLNLTPDQVQQVQGIQNDSMTQMQALHSDTSTAPADRRAKMMDIHKTEQEKIRAVLNDQQKPKYDAMVAHQQERMHDHMQGGGGDGSGQPPAQQ